MVLFGWEVTECLVKSSGSLQAGLQVTYGLATGPKSFQDPDAPNWVWDWFAFSPECPKVKKIKKGWLDQHGPEHSEV